MTADRDALLREGFFEWSGAIPSEDPDTFGTFKAGAEWAAARALHPEAVARERDYLRSVMEQLHTDTHEALAATRVRAPEPSAAREAVVTLKRPRLTAEGESVVDSTGGAVVDDTTTLIAALESIRDYDPDAAVGRGGRAEIVFDEWAYRRMVESYREAARAALARLDAEEAGDG